MRKKYYKPTYRVKDLKLHVLIPESIPWGGTGTLDSKGCSFDAEEDAD